MSSRRALASLFPLLTLVACSSEPLPVSTTDSGAVADTRSGADTSGTVDSARVPCSEPIEDRAPGSQCVKTVSGKVLNLTGAPVGGKLVSICGSVCFFGETQADGTFNAKIGSYIKVSNFAASVHGRPEHASLYEKLPASMSEDIALAGTMIVPGVPALGAKIPMDSKRVVIAATTVTHTDVSLNFAAGTTVDLDLEDVELIDKGGDNLRAVKVLEKDYPAFVRGTTVKVVYAMTPFDAKFDKKVGVTIANTGLPDGPVELIALGNEFLKEPFTAGTLQVVATGTAKGGTVTTDAGQGLTYLTWLGVRAK